MGTPVNVFTTPTDGGGASAMLPAALMASHSGIGGGMGAGLGAGLVGGLLGGLLFGGNGFGNRNGNNVDTSAIELGTARVAFDTVAMQSLNNITALIPTATGLVADKVNTGNMQLMNAIGSGFAMQNSTTLQQTIMLIQQLNAQNLTTMQELCNINQNVSAQGCQTREAVVADGNVTRSLLTSRFQLEDSTEINKLNAKVIELQNEGRSRELGERISINNTAVAAQQQGQQQQQQQQLVTTVNSLFPLLQGVLQVAHATNSNVIAGNTGAVTTGAQTASPVNVNA
jgi:hypothetical protein